MKLSILIFLLTTSYSCIQKQSHLSDEDKNMIRQEIRQMLHDYDQAVREKGLIGEFDYLDNSPDFFWVPPGYQSALSYDSVKSILSQNAPNFNSVKFEWLDLKINPLSNGLANYTGLVKSVMIDTSGKELVSLILETGTVIKRQAGWKILSGQSRLQE